MTRVLGMSLAALLAAAAAGSAQTTRVLTRPDAEYEEPFSRIAGIRELSDGRIILADPRDRTIQLLDLGAGRSTKIGREGKGPMEFTSPSAVFALPDERTVVYDGGNQRLLTIAPDGKITGERSTYWRIGESSGNYSPRAMDARGRIYHQQFGFAAGGARPDSAPVVRLDPATERTDTIAYVKLPRAAVTTQRAGTGTMTFSRANPFAARDVWAVAPDGRVAIIRPADYHVEWIAADGRRTVGSPVEYTPVRVTDDDRRVVEGRNADAPSVGFRVTQGNAPGVGGGSERRVTAPPSTDWPDTKPPFLDNAASVAPDGRLWVLRARSASDSVPTFDVFDAGARLAQRVVLPKATRLVGFGRGTVYLARMDDDGLEYLQRYRW
jgi:hypothetical protein